VAGDAANRNGPILTTIAILQSNYLPWKGYFDLIDAVDTFVVYDTVQYTKNDWRNRNKIKTPQGTRWLSVPVRQESLEQRIDETRVVEPEILRKHWMTITQNYRKAGAFREMKPLLEPLFDREAPELLSELNVSMLRWFCDFLDIDTPFVDSSTFELDEDRNLRLVQMCQALDADRYLSGPAARGYLDEQLFADHGIEVDWMDYSGYAEYDQPHPPFEHGVSIVDLVLSVGEDARSLLKAGASPR
jgi:hypothetical protein